MTTAFILDNQGVTHFTQLPVWNPEHSNISILVNGRAFKVKLVKMTKKGLALFREV